MNDNQTRLLVIIEMSGNNMHLTLIIVPGVDIPEMLSAEASYMDKMRNFSKKKKKSMTRTLWEESRIVLICPVTLNQVRESVTERGRKGVRVRGMEGARVRRSEGESGSKRDTKMT